MFREKIADLICDRAGTIAVEFGYLLPALLVIILCMGEVALAISDQMSVQAAARAGTHYGLDKPPVQNDMGPIISAVQAAMPVRWISGDAGGKPSISAALVCECEMSGAIQCTGTCGKNERMQKYLKVDVTKVHATIVSIQGWKPYVTLKNSSMVRLQ